MKIGDNCYILVNNRIIEEAIIRRISGILYTVKFTDSNKVIRVPKHRLYSSKEEATMSIPEIQLQSKRTNRPPGPH